MHSLKRWLLFKLIRHYYHGITEVDFIDLSKFDEVQLHNYCTGAKEIWGNETFQTELMRLRFKQEKYLAQKAQSEEDLIFGRAALYTIQEINKRFESLAIKADFKKTEE